MTATLCPDCLTQTDRRRQGQDARCDDCRAQVGQRRRDRQQQRQPRDEIARALADSQQAPSHRR